MQQFKIISTLLLMLALLVANRQEFTIYEDGHVCGSMAHMEDGVHDHHEHAVSHHLHMEEGVPHHHHHLHIVMDLDIVPGVRDSLLRCLFASFAVGAAMALLTSLFPVRWLRSVDDPPWLRYPERVSRIGGAGYCHPILN